MFEALSHHRDAIEAKLQSKPSPGLRPPSPVGRGTVCGEGLWWALVALTALAAVAPLGVFDRPDGDLPRRGVFGAVIGPVPESVRTGAEARSGGRSRRLGGPHGLDSRRGRVETG